MEATNNLEVKAGEYSDSAVIYKTDKARPEYKLKKGDSSNWMQSLPKIKRREE